MEILYLVIPLFILVGSVLGLVGFLRIGKLEDRIHLLELKLSVVERRETETVDLNNSDQQGASPGQEEPDEPSMPTPSSVDETQHQLDGAAASSATERSREQGEDQVHGRGEGISQPGVSEAVASRAAEPESPLIDWYALIQQHWMVILGGISLVFAGIFLVRYSIEHSILGPEARVSLGLLFGGTLVAAGEWLRRTDRLLANVHAAFVGAGILVLYSALLVAFHIYQLLSAELTFASLAFVSAISMLLALKHGPLMAGMGLLGAYLVPVLVSTSSNNIEAAMLYSFVVTCGSFWLQRYIYRDWLWWGTWIGSLAWFLMSMSFNEQAQGIRAMCIAGLAYIGLAFPFAGWKLESVDFASFSGRDIRKQLLGLFAVFTVANTLVVNHEVFTELSYPALALLPLVAILFTRNNLPEMKWLPAIVLLPVVFDLFSMQFQFYDWELTISPLPTGLWGPYTALLILLSGFYLSVAVYHVRNQRNPGFWASFALAIPLVSIVFAYLRIGAADGGLDWAVPTAAVGVFYVYLLDRWRSRNGATEVEAALAVTSQFAFSVACFMAFSEVTLTLVLAVQVVALAALYKRIPINAMPVLIKIMLALVIIRLTFNPWIVFYEASSFVLLLTYVGCLAAVFMAARELRDRDVLFFWLFSACAHLLVLTLAVITRYLVYGGDIFASEFNFIEASVYATSWAAIGLVYEWRSAHLDKYQNWYRIIARLHIVAAAVLYVIYLGILHNPLWQLEDMGTTPVLNILLLAYGAPVILSLLAYWQIPDFRKPAALLAFIGLYLFVTLEIRHLWHGQIKPDLPVDDGELYLYSLAWLILAVVTMLYGAKTTSTDVQKAGVAAMLVVIGKVFLWDMAGLDGLWRVISFLGLGLSLLGVAYLFNKLREKATN